MPITPDTQQPSNEEQGSGEQISLGVEAEIKRRQMPMRDVQSIERSGGDVIADFDDIEKFVEMPARKAVRAFFERNIKTGSSHANLEEFLRAEEREENELPEAYIVINYDSLSEANRLIAKEAGLNIAKSHDGSDGVTIFVLYSTDATVGEIEDKLYELAIKFKHQKLFWDPGLTYEQQVDKYKRMLPFTSEKAAGFVQDGIKSGSIYKDEETSLLFSSEKHARRYKESLKYKEGE